MPKTNFVNNVSTIPESWLDLVFNHIHDGIDEDGHAPLITQAQLDPSILALLQSIAIVNPTINALVYNGITRVNTFGGNGTDGAFVASGVNNTLNRGVYNFTDFTIGSAFSVNATGGIVRIKCTGNVNIQGTLIGVPSTHNRIASGFFVTADPPYNLSASLRGSSGSDGRRVTDTTGLETILGQGGKPATSIIIEALGTITLGSTSIVQAIGEAGQPGQVLSGTHSLPGSGGGTGGLIAITSLTSLNQQGTIDVTGGRGCDGAGANAEAGSGGSGGFLVVQAPTLTTVDAKLIALGGAAGVSLGDRRHWGSCGGSFAAKGGQRANSGESGIIAKAQSSLMTFY